MITRIPKRAQIGPGDAAEKPERESSQPRAADDTTITALLLLHSTPYFVQVCSSDRRVTAAATSQPQTPWLLVHSSTRLPSASSVDGPAGGVCVVVVRAGADGNATLPTP